MAEALANFIVGTRLRQIPPETVTFTKELILKCTAGMVAGSVTPAGRKVIKYLKGRLGSPEAGVVGCGFRTQVEDAILADGVFAHASELEDDQFPGGGTSNITVVPVLLPLAEKLKLPGTEVIEAALVGLEVQNRLGYATSPRTEERGIVGLPFFGVMGAVASSAKALKLDVEEVEAALGIAFTQGCGYTVNFGTDAHYLESAFSCRNGYLAAVMAREGMGSNPDFETWLTNLLGKDGVQQEKVTEGLGQRPYYIHNVWAKKYPCCFLTHRHADALLTLRKEQKLSPDQIAEVEAHVGETDAICDRPEPKDAEDAKFSFQHILASILLTGDIGLDTFTDDRISEPSYQEARRKVKVKVHPDWPRGFQSGIAKVTLRLTDGRELVKEMEQSIGGPKLPLTIEQYLGLYRKYAREALSEEHVERTANMILNLEKAKDILELADILTFRHAAYAQR